MDTTIFLAKLLGLLFIALGAFVIINKDKIKSIVNNLHSQPALLFLTGALNLLFGLLIVLSHNVWHGWPALITILGLLIILKGILRLFFPEQNTQLTNKALEGQGPVIWGAITVLIGAFLAYQGFSHYVI